MNESHDQDGTGGIYLPAGIGLPNLANTNTGCPVKFEVWTNNKCIFSISMSHGVFVTYLD